MLHLLVRPKAVVRICTPCYTDLDTAFKKQRGSGSGEDLIANQDLDPELEIANIWGGGGIEIPQTGYLA
jgi:hypothetical protein